MIRDQESGIREFVIGYSRNRRDTDDENQGCIYSVGSGVGIGLGVAAQIPCDFCVYAHTTMAKMYGATDEEIQEAVSKGAEVRHWSTILNGNQVEFEAFKKEWDGMLEFVKKNSK